MKTDVNLFFYNNKTPKWSNSGNNWGEKKPWTLEGIENKRRLQTLSIDNAWFIKNFRYYLTFRMLQHTSLEVIGYNCYKHLKIHKNDKINTPDSW